ncbi:OmpH family outer membrane protein [Olleya sp. R77988]|uniref:OmpH family outer membrane protein n=1 Tax=Olleya sp. R77988 TaxID=3093875 RepID=UPI0037CBCAD4
MKKIIGLLLITLIFTSCQNQKIGYVDNVNVINGIKEKIDLEKKYETKESAFKLRTDSIGKAFQLEAQKTQLDAQKMSKSKATAKFEALGKKQKMLQEQLQFEQQQLAQGFQKEMDTIIEKVKTFVKDYGKTNGFDLILGTVDASPSVMFAKDQYDLSEKVINAMDADYNK